MQIHPAHCRYKLLRSVFAFSTTIMTLASGALTSNYAAADVPAQQSTTDLDASANYRAGKTAYDAQHYDVAIVQWQRSLLISNANGLKFNLAQAYRLRGLPGDCVTATKFYTEFAAAATDAKLKLAATAFIEELAPCVTTQVKQANVEASAKAIDVEAREHARTKASAALAIALDQRPRRRPPVVAPRPVASSLLPAPPLTKFVEQPRSPRFRIATITAAGFGVAAIGVGAFFSARAQSASDEINAACTNSGVPCLWTTERQATEDRGQQAAQAQWVFYGVGGVALVAAGTLYYLGHRTAAQRVAIVPTSSTAGILSWSGSW